MDHWKDGSWGLLGLLLGLGDGALPESVPETPPDHSEMTESAGASGLPPLGLNRPVVLTDLSLK